MLVLKMIRRRLCFMGWLAPLLEEFKVFVNDSLFSLRDPQDLIGEAEPNSDLAGRQYQSEIAKELQELFWLQLELKEVETYISAGARLTLVTQRQELYQRLVESVGGSNGV